MAARKPKVKRVMSPQQAMPWILTGVAVLLVGVIVALLASEGVFDAGPKSDAERDYQLLVDGLQKNPDDPAILMTLAEVEYDLGKKADAIAHAERAVKVAKDPEGWSVRLAALYVRDGQIKKAKTALETELKGGDGTNDGEAYFLLGQVERDLGDLDAALKALEKAVEIMPVNADVRLVYAEVLEKAGKRDEAATQFQAALKFLPGDERALAGLKRLGVKPEETTSSPHATGTPGQ
ncbi:tetratricopeptide repeat protein [Coriobacteriia bacterium Es71-Z0120]|uniref:tetratricopeptide repeat protein n=1 Tax=Parvivirga hydrogeniphila TaxID=2939460 RepID=UPI002260CE68|nr:tetratricopeptide repeat protein [Parvivirga hydrogeniphila]MCL4079322.1 tetratricopeptide repeat protein [Parvivirga hydrogeniphila]